MLFKKNTNLPDLSCLSMVINLHKNVCIQHIEKQAVCCLYYGHRQETSYEKSSIN